MNATGPAVPRVLSIAGTDPTGGAGSQADIKAIAAAGGFGYAVITAVLAQNTRGVRAVEAVAAPMIRAQLDAVFEDCEVDAVKIGMLGAAATIALVREELARRRPPLVVLDPVMIATSGDRLLDEDAEDALRGLCRMADVLTPNIPELAVLAGAEPAGDLAAAVEQARGLAAQVDAAVLVKGGHLDGPTADNVLVRADGAAVHVSAPRIDTTTTHGTGCSLSSALATRLARGDAPEDALRWTTRWLVEAIANGAALQVGGGHGPVDHGHRARRLAAAADTRPWPGIGAIPAALHAPEELARVADARADAPTPRIPAAGPWTAALWRIGSGVHREILGLPFITELAAGTLPRGDFDFYLAQDARYLAGYGRALAHLGSRAPGSGDRVEWAASAVECINVEAELHRDWLSGAEDAGSSPVTAAYVDFLLARALGEDYAVGAAAVLPCYWLYAEVGLELAGANRPDHPYRRWLDTYSGEEFLEEVRAALRRVERAMSAAGPEVRAVAARAHLIACRHEREFFDQAGRLGG